MNKSKYHKKVYLIRKKIGSIGAPFGECTECGGATLFYDKYDTFCCLGCNIWLTPKCSDSECPYCSGRPETPSEAIFFDNESVLYAKDWRRDNYFHKKQGELKHKARTESDYIRHKFDV